MPPKKSYPANKKIIYNNVIKDSSRLFTCIGGAQMGHRIRDGDLYKIAGLRIRASPYATDILLNLSVKSGSRLPYIPILFPSLFTRQREFPLQRLIRMCVSIMSPTRTFTVKNGAINAVRALHKKMYPDWAEMINKSVVSNLSERNATIHKNY